MSSQRCQFRVCCFLVLLLISFAVSLWLGHPSSWRVAAAPANVDQLVQQGVKQYQSGDFPEAIQSWQTALNVDQRYDGEDRVTVLKYLARAYQQVGRIDQAIAQMETVVAYYRQKKDTQQVERMLTEQAQLYSGLGQQRRSITILCGQGISGCNKDSALETARRQRDSLGEVAALGSLGNAYRLQGEYERAIQYLEKSLEIAKRIENRVYTASTLNGLANTYASLAKRDNRRAQLATLAGDQTAQKFQQNAVGNDIKAAQYFEDSLRLARAQKDRQSELRSLLGLIRDHRDRQAAPVDDTIQQALIVLESLPDSHDKAYAAIKLAGLNQLVLANTNATEEGVIQCSSQSPPKSVELLNKAIKIAQRIQDQEAAALALGRLGHIYECRQDYKEALNLTQQAQLASDAKQSFYLWKWQAGRILKAQGYVADAVNAYTESVKSLKSIRGNLASASREFQFDFRDTVEPVYREAIDLILHTLEDHPRLKGGRQDAADIQANLQTVLETVDELRLAELQNYLGNDCTLLPVDKPVGLVDRSTAVFNSIILKDRIAIILTLPDGEQLRHQVHSVPAKSQEVVETINDLRLKLEDRSDLENNFRARSQQVYGWFIHPFAAELDRAKIQTLVFIQDGILRSIPMAALYDGKQFLMQKYAIANTPSLTLANPTQLKHQDLRVLAFGLTKSATVSTSDGQTFFGPLSEVKTELNSIKTVIPASKSLLNEDFSSNRLKQELEKSAYPIIHLATHGQFGFDARETFLVTGQLAGQNSQNTSSQHYNEKLTMDELYQIITSTRHDNPIELLTLSACETAVGSDRDALGIAGISLQAGSQSAMASLWEVDDQATAQLIVHFYQGLREGMSRAKALQNAQKAWLEAHPDGLHSHPGYWAAFILTGNWL